MCVKKNVRYNTRMTETQIIGYGLTAELIDQCGPDPATANLTELASIYRRIEGTLLDRWDAPLVNDFLCMVGFGASRALLGKWAGEAGLMFHNDVMIGQANTLEYEGKFNGGSPIGGRIRLSSFIVFYE